MVRGKINKKLINTINDAELLIKKNYENSLKFCLISYFNLQIDQ